MVVTFMTFLMTLIIFLISYFGFGLWLLSKLNLKITLSLLERGVLATAISISLVVSVMALLGQFISTNTYWTLVLTGALSLTNFKQFFKYLKSVKKQVFKNKLLVGFFLVCTLVLASTIGFSGATRDGSLRLQEVHDSVWHISLVENLLTSVPPKHPSDPSILLNSYHYFYDLFLASLTYFSRISLFTLYYQYSVVFLGVFISSAAFVLGKRMHGVLAAYYLTTFTVFSGSFAYLIPLFIPGRAWHESSFWVRQTLVMMVNPQVIYTLGITYIFIFILHLISNIQLKKSDALKFHIVLSLLAATSIGFKSYAWVLLTAIYGVFLLVELITKKSLRTILTGIFYVTLSVPLVWLITRFKGNSFFYEPLWFTNTMIESPDRVNYLEWKFLQDHYLWKKNWLRLYFLEARKLAVFYLGNLGIRSFFLGLPILAIIRKKFFSNNPVLSYVFFGFLFNSVFPLLFLQRGTVWNSIQFWYYALIFANVLVALFISELLKNKSTLTVVFVSLLLFVLAIPTSVKTIVDKNRSPYVLPAEEVQYLRSLSASDHVLICPEGSTLYKSALVKAITPAEVYVANPSQLTLVGSDQSKAKRVAEIIDQNNVADFTELLEKDRVTKIICTDASLTDKVLKMLQITGEKYGSITAITLEQ